ncbi:uncharacterized protein LOC103569398 [Microplitis demolitor]|uniref:uncharacterized protein LOC103569398 n=1 Tax=Microplitis demolitor TaxID=69319 RepID=UPI0004CCF769|nr:uncharacterized protein LOC103569398 [Microplitis demolitor]
MAKFSIILLILYLATSILAASNDLTPASLTSSNLNTSTSVSRPSLREIIKSTLRTLVNGLVSGFKVLLTPVKKVLELILNIIEKLIDIVMRSIAACLKTFFNTLGLPNVATTLITLSTEIQDAINNLLQSIKSILSTVL